MSGASMSLRSCFRRLILVPQPADSALVGMPNFRRLCFFYFQSEKTKQRYKKGTLIQMYKRIIITL